MLFIKDIIVDKLTPSDIIGKKYNEKIIMITAYDALFAKIFDEYADIILVGDSLNMSFNGQKDTLNIGVDEMIYHTKAVKAGTKRAMVVTDMPFGSYTDPRNALKNAIQIYKESGADAVKLEGGTEVAPIIKELTKQGINVVGHIGLLPQKVRFESGYKIKGRGENEREKLLEDAYALCDAGVFCIVLEGTLSDIAAEISMKIDIPIVGIGSGGAIDGQVLVWSDMLGFFGEFKPKFVKRYLDGTNLVKNAVSTYVNEVKSELFPSEEFEYKK